MTPRPNVTVSDVRVTWKMGNRINKYKCIIDSRARGRNLCGRCPTFSESFRGSRQSADVSVGEKRDARSAVRNYRNVELAYTRVIKK